VRLIADHVIEIDDGGAPLDVNNGMTLCLSCHNRKTAAARIERMRR
jgi:5-methylcytosine-specific restriction protein A